MDGGTVLELLRCEIKEHLLCPFGLAVRLRQHILAGVAETDSTDARSGRTDGARKARRHHALHGVPCIDLAHGVFIWDLALQNTEMLSPPFLILFELFLYRAFRL